MEGKFYTRRYFTDIIHETHSKYGEGSDEKIFEVDLGQNILRKREEIERIGKKQPQIKGDEDSESSKSRSRGAMNLSLIRMVDGAKASGSRPHPWGQEKGEKESHEEQDEIFNHF